MNGTISPSYTPWMYGFTPVCVFTVFVVKFVNHDCLMWYCMDAYAEVVLHFMMMIMMMMHTSPLLCKLNQCVWLDISLAKQGPPSQYLPCMVVLWSPKMEHVSQKNFWKLFYFVILLHLEISIWRDLTLPQCIHTSSGPLTVPCVLGVGSKVVGVWSWPLISISIFFEVIRMNGAIPSFLHILLWCSPKERELYLYLTLVFFPPFFWWQESCSL
jgi:hypothetical protein